MYFDFLKLAFSVPWVASTRLFNSPCIILKGSGRAFSVSAILFSSDAQRGHDVSSFSPLLDANDHPFSLLPLPSPPLPSPLSLPVTPD